MINSPETLTKENILELVLKKDSDKRKKVQNEFNKWVTEELSKIKSGDENQMRKRRSSNVLLNVQNQYNFEIFANRVLDFFAKNSKNINWQNIANDSKSMNEIVSNCDYGENFDVIRDTTNNSENTNNSKSCNHNITEVKSILKLLGILRHNVIDIIIDNLNIKMNINNYYYTAFGSTNITSDFDLTICGGPKANLLCWNIFKTYYDIYKSTLPQNFDSNLYVGAYDVHSSSNSYNEKAEKYIKKFNMKIKKNNKESLEDENLFTINIRQNEKTNNPEDLKYAYTWALVKVIESGIEKKEFKNSKSLEDYFNNAITLKKKINNILCNNGLFDSIKKEEIIFSYENNPETIKTITNYYMQYYIQEIVNQKIYQKYSREKNDEIEEKVNEIIDKNNNLIYLRSFNNFFSSEAYYTDMTVQAIVLEDQAGGNLELTNDHYLIAALENVGDFYKHSSHDINKDDYTGFKTLIKYSKYIYRIYMCLSNVNKDKYQKIRDEIKDSWVKLRKTYNRNKICDENENEKVVCYEKGVKALNIKDFDKKTKYDKLKAIKDKLLNDVITEYNKIHNVQSGGYYNKYMKYKKKYLNLKNNQ